MADATSQFFEGLAGRGHEPLLAKAKGSIRFELQDGKQTERWLVEFDRGTVAVSRKNAAADCVARGDRALMARIVRGDENAFVAVLRGAVEVEGAVALLVLFQKLFPGPPRSRRRRRAA